VGSLVFSLRRKPLAWAKIPDYAPVPACKSPKSFHHSNTHPIMQFKSPFNTQTCNPEPSEQISIRILGKRLAFLTFAITTCKFSSQQGDTSIAQPKELDYRYQE